jgi:hypothetical protein
MITANVATAKIPGSANGSFASIQAQLWDLPLRRQAKKAGEALTQ